MRMHRQNLLYHSVFQLVPVSHSSYEELVHVLLSQAVWNLEATGVSNFVSGDSVVQTLNLTITLCVFQALYVN